MYKGISVVSPPPTVEMEKKIGKYSSFGFEESD